MKRSALFSILRTLTLAAVALFATCPATSWASTVTHVPLYTFHGDSTNDGFGHSVSGAGDVNGDGHDDLIVGTFRPFGGKARVLSGFDGSTLYSFDGDVRSDLFGYSVSGAGDVNGDGRADLIVGSPLSDNIAKDVGSARVLSGLDGSTLYTFYGDASEDYLGHSVSSAGDVNGDGRPDLIVGAWQDDNNGENSGSARVLSGLDGSTLYTFDGDAEHNLFGISVSGVGDVNGDGRADLIVGASVDSNGEGSGSARVLSGLDGSTLYTFDGDSADDRFGISVSGAGDVNGDGRPDLIVGAIRPLGGYARVLSGLDGSTLYTFHGDSTNDRFGHSVSGAGDVNGDGRADLLVGAWQDDNNGERSGSARVLSGLDGSTLYTFDGDAEYGRFGHSVSGAGDVNGDGLADFIVGAPYGGLNDRGYAQVFVSQIVPEPTSLLLASFAVVGLLGRRRG